MCCIRDFFVKYLLILANVLFSLAGITIVALGTIAHIQLNKISDIIPVNTSSLSISIIVLGVFIFLISYLACCGAIRESMCMLVTYSVLMAILAGIKIYIAYVFFEFLDGAQTTVVGWIESAFNNQSAREAFHVMESLFSCCGTVGSSVYGNTIPASCCADPINNQCTEIQSYDGCNVLVLDWFEAFGGAIAGVLIFIIIVEVVCVLFGCHLTNTIRNTRRREFN